MVVGNQESTTPQSEGGLVRIRIAPTPSGYLHEGNLVNMVLTHRWAAAIHAEVHLRIDSIDADRVRPEYVKDILDSMSWLGIDYVRGPRSEQEADSDRAHRITRAREQLIEARDRGLMVYACDCSRARGGSSSHGGCPGGCRSRGLAFVPGETSLRVIVPDSTTIDVQGRSIDLGREMGDFVVWRRDDLPAYQWTSVVDDSDAGMTHILRGEDLSVSTGAQLFLARHLPDPSFLDADIRHHPLLTGPDGAKLSKSQLGRRDALHRTDELLDRISAMADSLGRAMGLPAAAVTDLPS